MAKPVTPETSKIHPSPTSPQVEETEHAEAEPAEVEAADEEGPPPARQPAPVYVSLRPPPVFAAVDEEQRAYARRAQQAQQSGEMGWTTGDEDV
jgi:hypothetical protein